MVKAALQRWPDPYEAPSGRGVGLSFERGQRGGKGGNSCDAIAARGRASRRAEIPTRLLVSVAYNEYFTKRKPNFRLEHGGVATPRWLKCIMPSSLNFVLLKHEANKSNRA